VKLNYDTRDIPTDDIHLSENNMVDPENRYEQAFKIQIELPAGFGVCVTPLCAAARQSCRRRNSLSPASSCDMCEAHQNNTVPGGRRCLTRCPNFLPMRSPWSAKPPSAISNLPT
jgi:hypothetical protein